MAYFCYQFFPFSQQVNNEGHVKCRVNDSYANVVDHVGRVAIDEIMICTDCLLLRSSSTE